MRGLLRIVFERDRSPAPSRRPDRIAREEVVFAVRRTVLVAGATDRVPWRRNRLDIAEEHLTVPECQVRCNTALLLDRWRVAGVTEDRGGEAFFDRTNRARRLVPMAEEHVTDTAKLLHAVVIGPIVDLADRLATGAVVCRTGRCPISSPADRHGRLSWESPEADAPA